jgi:hypothetical protein
VKQEGRAHSTSDTLDAHTASFSPSCDGYEVEEQGPNPKLAKPRLNGFCGHGLTGPNFFFSFRLLMSSSDLKEKELTTRQAALVDSAFEEGQYESGIAMLEQLCSPTDYPSR